jgi:hypothetical protein
VGTGMGLYCTEKEFDTWGNGLKRQLSAQMGKGPGPAVRYPIEHISSQVLFEFFEVLPNWVIIQLIQRCDHHGVNTASRVTCDYPRALTQNASHVLNHEALCTLVYGQHLLEKRPRAYGMA